MLQRRKSKHERDYEHNQAEQRGWQDFRTRLDSVQNFAEAMQLTEDAPPTDAPGRKYYSNLGTFLTDFSVVPAGTSYEEKALYLQLIQRLDAMGDLKSGSAEMIIEKLKKAMDDQKNREGL